MLCVPTTDSGHSDSSDGEPGCGIGRSSPVLIDDEVSLLRSVLSECVPSDHYCVTCVRDLSPAEVMARLGVADQDPYPRCTPEEAVERFDLDVPAVRVHHEGDWVFVLEVNSQLGVTFKPQMLARLSEGSEAVSAQQLLDSTAKVAHARQGELLATYIDWHFEPPSGKDPSRLNRALTQVGFFREENEDSDEWEASKMILVAVEREFGLTVSPEVVNGPLPTAVLPYVKAPAPPREPLQRKPSADGSVVPKLQAEQARNDDHEDGR
ncbi:hypothetical protein FB559_0429 [Actinoallomurus bryophytorum]|uniref:Uncharacterized protein n=1 Tax=Actinoallomurus bryophytorum TaxID=1490222 RepID=A0A543CD60_9ACTN|nr:hypothetical protein FB559_0429 [Actinoallomurus bryophytorum]